MYTHTQITLHEQQQAIWAASPSRYTFPYLRIEVGCLRLRATHAWLRGASTSCHCYQSAVSVAQGDWRPPAPLPDAPRCEQELSPWRARIETAPRECSSSCAPSCLSSRLSILACSRTPSWHVATLNYRGLTPENERGVSAADGKLAVD